MQTSEQFSGYNEKKELTSDFNEAKFQILRLNSLYLDCNRYSKGANNKQWRWTLDTIWRELSNDAMEKDGYKKHIEWIEKAINDKTTYLYQMNTLNNEITKVSNNKDELYMALQKKEMFLRALQDDVGKGSRKRSADEDDMDE